MFVALGLVYLSIHVTFATLKGFDPISDGVASLNLRIHNKSFAFIAVYLPHAGNSVEVVEATYNQLHMAAEEASRSGRVLVIGGDFTRQLEIGTKGDQLAAFASSFNLYVDNEPKEDQSFEDTWTFCSSMQIKRCIDFILASGSVWTI